MRFLYNKEAAVEFGIVHMVLPRMQLWFCTQHGVHHTITVLPKSFDQPLIIEIFVWL